MGCCIGDVMLPSKTLLKHRLDIQRLMERYPMLTNLRVCGSVARGQDCEGSDIDFLVEPGPDATLFDMGGLREDLEDLLGVPVDIISVNGRMDESMKETMLREAVTV